MLWRGMLLILRAEVGRTGESGGRFRGWSRAFIFGVNGARTCVDEPNSSSSWHTAGRCSWVKKEWEVREEWLSMVNFTCKSCPKRDL